jgi:hypothetical protein
MTQVNSTYFSLSEYLEKVEVMWNFKRIWKYKKDIKPIFKISIFYFFKSRKVLKKLKKNVLNL